MKVILGLLLAGSLVVAGQASAGKGCTAKKAQPTPSCKWSKDAQAKKCGGCAESAKAGKSLREAGAQVELVQTKRGFIVLATGDSPELVAKIKKVSEKSLRELAGLTEKAGKLPCEKCNEFAKAVKAGDITFERMETKAGVVTVYTAQTEDALATLKNCCGALWGLKA